MVRDAGPETTGSYWDVNECRWVRWPAPLPAQREDVGVPAAHGEPVVPELAEAAPTTV